jgi:hypothetical protein
VLACGYAGHIDLHGDRKSGLYLAHRNVRTPVAGTFGGGKIARDNAGDMGGYPGLGVAPRASGRPAKLHSRNPPSRRRAAKPALRRISTAS